MIVRYINVHLIIIIIIIIIIIMLTEARCDISPALVVLKPINR